MKKLFLLFIFLIVIQFDIHSQTEIDTLYQFPDTTQFYPYGNGPWTDDIANLAVKVPLIDTLSYKIKSLEVLFPAIDTLHHPTNISIRISVGDLPEQKIIIEKYIESSAYYPYWQKIYFDSLMIITGNQNLYISGSSLFFMCTSSVNDSMYSNNYRYNWWIEKWQEGTYILFPIKVIVEKNVSDITDNNFKNVPLKFKLYQNYPNPFNPATTIKYELNQSGYLRIEIYNSIGVRVDNLFNGYRNKGTYEIKYTPRRIAAGVYYCKFLFNNYMEVKKIVFLK